MQKTFLVEVETLARVSARFQVTTEVDGKTDEEVQQELEEVAKQKAADGEEVWKYNGIAEPEEYEVTGVYEK